MNTEPSKSTSVFVADVTKHLGLEIEIFPHKDALTKGGNFNAASICRVHRIDKPDSGAESAYTDQTVCAGNKAPFLYSGECKASKVLSMLLNSWGHLMQSECLVIGDDIRNVDARIMAI